MVIFVGQLVEDDMSVFPCALRQPRSWVAFAQFGVLSHCRTESLVPSPRFNSEKG